MWHLQNLEKVVQIASSSLPDPAKPILHTKEQSRGAHLTRTSAALLKSNPQIHLTAWA